MRIEILHVRDPDYECSISLWLDGKIVDTGTDIELDVVDIDPGRGYEAAMWADDRESVENNPHYSDSFRKTVLEAHDGAAASKYID